MDKPKVIAFFLPQYHVIEENNEWWGKGFTEWNNVRKGKPLFKSHEQPKVPYQNNYYDLLLGDTLSEQSKLAGSYGVDGFCFYHYWFKGKKLLEKPVEMLAVKPEIDISYCLSWANETWSRRWTGEEKKILIKQEYGGKSDWEAHIQYLLPFFRDRRYIRIDNKPVFLIYRAIEIPDCEEMISYWDKRLVEEGFSGLYLIETLNSVQKKSCLRTSSALVEFEPMYTIYSDLNYLTRLYRYCFNHFGLHRAGLRDYLNYDRIYKNVLKRKRNYEKKTFLGVFPDWDNTARKGEAGLVIRKGNPTKFQYYFKKQYKNSDDMKNEFLFINAWNEWGEGAYLEPDIKNKFGYLQAIRNVVEGYKK